MEDAADKKVYLTVFPELCITGYTCGDLWTVPTARYGNELIKRNKARVIKMGKCIHSGFTIVD